MLQALLGHKDVNTMMMYTYVFNRRGQGVRSPADALIVAPGWSQP